MRGALGDQTLIYLQIAQLLEDDILRGVYREEEPGPLHQRALPLLQHQSRHRCQGHQPAGGRRNFV